jgi:hypothetical protein
VYLSRGGKDPTDFGNALTQELNVTHKQDGLNFTGFIFPKIDFSAKNSTNQRISSAQHSKTKQISAGLNSKNKQAFGAAN